MPKNYKLYEKIIPKFIPNCMVWSVFSVISFLTGPVKSRIRDFHYEENSRILSERGASLFKDKGYIENQAELNEIYFGTHKKSNLSYSGCEIIATYNALTSLMDNSATLPYLIRYFEQKGITLKGGFGISPSAPYRFFKNRGYDVKKITTRNKEAIRSLGEQYQTFITTFYWNVENIKDQLHTVNISKEPNGFYIHNNYYRGVSGTYMGQGPYKSLDEAVYSLGERTAVMVVVAIRNRKS